MKRAWVIVALGLVACGRNAIFELEVELPPQPPGAPVFAVFAASADPGFAWRDAPSLDGVPLPSGCVRPAEPPPCALRTLDPVCSLIVSVVADHDLERPLRLRARFCDDPDCAGDGAPPEHRLEVERAFYAGRYTQGRTCIDVVPTDPAPPPETLARCDVRCREGSAAMSCRLDGTHFCE